jgi:hypothetical protein
VPSGAVLHLAGVALDGEVVTGGACAAISGTILGATVAVHNRKCRGHRPLAVPRRGHRKGIHFLWHLETYPAGRFSYRRPSDDLRCRPTPGG